MSTVRWGLCLTLLAGCGARRLGVSDGLDAAADAPLDASADRGIDAPGELAADALPADACRPACAAHTCGPDGCGGSCGSCQSGTLCSGDGRCVPCEAGAVCEGGACDGRGGCVPSGAQSGCAHAGTPGCGLVPVTGGGESVGESRSFHAPPGLPAVTVSPFAMDTHEVTVARFRAFWEAGHPAPGPTIAYRGGRSLPWTGAVVEPGTAQYCTWSLTVGAREAHPINCVDYWTSQAFCVWDGGRLPTEAEWEYAARGRAIEGVALPRTYPWGNTAPTRACDLARWNDFGCPGDDGVQTRRVGSFAPSGGLYDLAGNVWEWTADNFIDYGDPQCWPVAPQTDPLCLTVPTTFRAVRGGSWRGTDGIYLRSASRHAITPEYHDFEGGFRCARGR